MTRMLERELEGIEHEIIRNVWSRGLKKATGSFVCLLETNSAIEPGALRANLSVFTENPYYRKLAMVSPAVDFVDAPERLIFSWNDGLKGYHASQLKSMRDCRIGYVPGAIIRRSSLLGSSFDHILNPRTFTRDVCFNFWSRGLRVSVNPETTYAAPEKTSYKNYKDTYEPDEKVIQLWDHELIT